MSSPYIQKLSIFSCLRKPAFIVLIDFSSGNSCSSLCHCHCTVVGIQKLTWFELFGYLNRKSSETYGDTFESQPKFRVKLSKKEEEDEGNFGITFSSLGFGGFDSKRNQFEISYRDLHVDIIKLGMNYIS